MKKTYETPLMMEERILTDFILQTVVESASIPVSGEEAGEDEEGAKRRRGIFSDGGGSIW